MLHYLSILSGPIICSVFLGIFCLIPIRNIMKEPSYWYEDVVIRTLTISYPLAAQTLFRAEFWSDFSFKSRWFTHALIIGFTHVILSFAFSATYFVWTFYLGYHPPMPLNQYAVGSIVVISINAILWFR